MRVCYLQCVCLDHHAVTVRRPGNRINSAFVPQPVRAQALPRGVMWYADPAGPAEIQEFRLAGHLVRRGMNDIRLGIAAVTARLRTGRLKIDPRRCPSLCAEAKLYRYPSEHERALSGENPIDEHNHALAALRYLIARIDARFIARLRRGGPAAERTNREEPHYTEAD